MGKKRKLKKLKKYLFNIENPKSPFPDKDYLDYHKPELDTLKWLIAYYEGRSGCKKPQQYLEAVIYNNTKHKRYEDYCLAIKGIINISIPTPIEFFNIEMRIISFLYNWIYYNKITGF